MPGHAEERQLIADAGRVLAARRLAEGYLGHVSLRVDHERLLPRPAGARPGLDHDRGRAPGHPRRAPGDDGELAGWTPPNELPLHTQVLRARRDVAAVVHAHPPAVLAADLAGIGIRPVVLLRGHGLTSAGTSVQQAVLDAVSVDRIARR